MHSDIAVQLRVGGLPDLAHAAFAEESGDVIVPEARTGTESHDQGLNGSFYAEAFHASSLGRRCAPGKTSAGQFQDAHMRVCRGSVASRPWGRSDLEIKG